jgi:DNA-binding transcriptional LysR family regulator
MSVRTGLSPDLGQGLLAREFDLVITSDALEEIEGVDRHELLEEGFLVITPKSLKTRLQSLTDLKLLAEAMPLIRFNRESHLGGQIDRVVRRHGVKAGRTLEMDTSEVLTSMVAGELGWAVTTPMCLLQAQHLASQLNIAAIDALTGMRSIYLLARQDQHRQVVHKVLETTSRLLEFDVVPRLAAMHPALPALLRLRGTVPNPASPPPSPSTS